LQRALADSTGVIGFEAAREQQGGTSLVTRLASIGSAVATPHTSQSPRLLSMPSRK
jgi:hypothetical protein